MDGRADVRLQWSGLFGYSHLYGGFAGGQAEYVRVPFADVGPLVLPEGIEDEKVLFLTDILPTAYMAAENGNIKPGDVVAVWGCGPVGLLTIMCAFALGAERVIAIDSIDYRLEGRPSGRGAAQLPGHRTIEALKEIDRRARAGRMHRRGGAGGTRHQRGCLHGPCQVLWCA